MIQKIYKAIFINSLTENKEFLNHVYSNLEVKFDKNRYGIDGEQKSRFLNFPQFGKIVQKSEKLCQMF